MPDALRNLAIYFSCATQALGGFILSVLATVLSFALPPLRKATETQIRPFYVHASRSAGSSISTVTSSTVPSTSSSLSTPRSDPSTSDPIRTPHDSPDQPPTTLPTRSARSRPSRPSLPDRALNFVLPPPSSQRASSPPSSSEHRSRPSLAVKCAEQVKSLTLTPIDETKVAQPRPPTLRKGSSSSYLPHFGRRSTQPPASSSADGVRPRGHRKLCRSVSLPSKASWHKERTVPERSQTAPVPVDKYPNIPSKAAPALPTPASAAPKRKYLCPRSPRRSRSLSSQSNASLADASPKKTVVPLSRPPKHCRKPSASSSNSACTTETAPVSAALPSPPIARTRPYEAPYYFPTPASPEARNYVRNTRQLMRKASTVFRDIGDGLHSSTSPSVAPALRGTAADVATSPVSGLSVAQEEGNVNSTGVIVGDSSDAAVVVDEESDGRRKGKAKPITTSPKAVASALRR